MINDQEQERFMRLWTDAQPAVVNYLHAMVRDPVVAKDLVQETALVLFRRFGDYDGQRPFLAWALGVAKMQVLGLHRDGARSFVTFDTELFEKFTEVWADIAPTASEQSAALEVVLGAIASAPKADGAIALFRGTELRGNCPSTRHEKRRGAGRAATYPRATPRLHRAANASGKAAGMSDPQKLIAACLEDALSDAQRDELVAWLKAHPDHLRAFVEANLFEQQIRHAVHGQVQREAAMHLVESGHSLQPEPHRHW